MNEEPPYLKVTVTRSERRWNPRYHQDAKCKCGHPYERHFDSYDGMDPIGCKHCSCYVFEAADLPTVEIVGET